ncbi:MAG: glycoside hydrolase family 38 C-terminal domain-containing protein [Tannerellaceae bacterium]
MSKSRRKLCNKCAFWGYLLFAIFIVQRGVAKDSTNLQFTEESLTVEVLPFYKKRSNGDDGRAVKLIYNGKEQLQKAKIKLLTSTGEEVSSWSDFNNHSMTLLLPPNVGVEQSDTICVRLQLGKNKSVEKVVPIPQLRKWTVFIYPHSHVDIGYTNTQENVAIIHKRNLDTAMVLHEQTKDYPDGARFVWNTEVTWPVERYLATEPTEKQARLLRAIKEGAIGVEAGLVHTNTTAAGEEELYELFRYSKKIEALTGKPIQTMVQIDIPGMSWGVVPVASQMGIKYIMSMNNGGDRVGKSMELSFKPFWWIGQDGKSKVLFLQPGAYTPGAHAKGGKFWPKMAGQTDPDKLLTIVKTDNPRADFIDAYLWPKLEELGKADYYPYDIFPMTWCMADNTPIDADLPEAVKSWNEEYAYPRLQICTATDIMKAFDDKYGAQIPQRSGDFTEYWTDGLGSEAKHTGRNREVKEELIQTETLWSMLNPGKPAPRDQLEEAWQNVLLGTEHTWAFMDPNRQPLQDQILGVKLGYFKTADSISRVLRGELVPEVAEKNVIAIFNTHSWPQSGLVKLSSSQSRDFDCVTDKQGVVIPSQRLSGGELVFYVHDVPALGMAKIKLSKGKKQSRTTSFAKENILDNGIVRVVLDPYTGDLTSLQYKNQEYVDPKSTYSANSFRYLRGDNSPGKATKASNVKICVKEDGPVLASLLVTSDADGCDLLERTVTILAGTPEVLISNNIQKQPILDKEGIHFGFAFNMDTPVIKADMPWSVVELEKDQFPEGNRNWIAFQRWLNVSDSDKSITWCAPNAATFEVGDITANILGGATNSPRWMRNLSQSATIISWALNNHWHTNFPLKQEGVIRFDYKLLPHAHGFCPVKSNQFGVEQIQPLVAFNIDDTFSFDQNLQLESDPSIMISIVKTINKGKSTIVRLRSVSDKQQSACLKWLRNKPEALRVCNLYEEAEGSNLVDQEITVSPMGFVTLRADW